MERIQNVKIASIVPIIYNPISGRPMVSTRLRRPASACRAVSQPKTSDDISKFHLAKSSDSIGPSHKSFRFQPTAPAWIESDAAVISAPPGQHGFAFPPLPGLASVNPPSTAASRIFLFTRRGRGVSKTISPLKGLNLAVGMADGLMLGSWEA